LAYGYDLVLLLHVASAAVLLGLLAFVAFNWREPLAPPFGFVLGFLLLWTLAYVAELAAVGLSAKLAWANVQFVSAAVLPLLWLLTMRKAVGARPLPRTILVLLWLGCTATILCVYANPGHLFRGVPTLDRSGPIVLVDADYGLLYHGLWLPFAYGLLMWTILDLTCAAVRGQGLARARGRLLLAATLVPVIAGLAFIAGLLPWPNFNPAMSSLSVSVLLLAVVLVRHRMFDLTPLARDTVIEQLPDAIIVVDPRGSLVDFNPAARGLLPELSCDVLGQPLESLFGERPALKSAVSRARDDMAEAAGGEQSRASGHGIEQAIALSVTGPEPHAEPEERHYSLYVTPVVRGGGERLGEVIVLRDVSESVRLYRHMRRLANTDELSGLLSRRRLLELGSREVARARRHARPLAVLLLDLDRFKLVNDVHGHVAGDEALRALGAICRVELRESDLAGRYGGDEICIVLPELDERGALAVAERLRAAVAGLSIDCDGETLGVTVSIGVAAAGLDEEPTLKGLIAAADTALYAAKREGRDRVSAGVGAVV